MQIGACGGGIVMGKSPVGLEPDICHVPLRIDTGLIIKILTGIIYKAITLVYTKENPYAEMCQFQCKNLNNKSE